MAKKAKQPEPFKQCPKCNFKVSGDSPRTACPKCGALYKKAKKAK